MNPLWSALARHGVMEVYGGFRSTQLEPGCLSADNGEVIMGRGISREGNWAARWLRYNPHSSPRRSKFQKAREASFFCCSWCLPFVVWSICLVKVLLTDGRPEASHWLTIGFALFLPSRLPWTQNCEVFAGIKRLSSIRRQHFDTQPPSETKGLLDSFELVCFK